MMKMLSTPRSVRNLTAWFVMDPVAEPCPDYAVLEDAMASARAVLHETGNVNELLIENLGDIDLLIQAGDIVKGGRQDRMLGADFIVPAKSGRIPIPVFCVESARWHKRRSESETHFSQSLHFAASKSTRVAAREHKSQSAVWESVMKEQQEISCSIGHSAQHPASPSSLDLTYSLDSVNEALREFSAGLEAAPVPGATGVVWCINGKPSHAEVYGNPALFSKVWNKLQRAAALEAIAESRKASPAGPGAADADAAAVVRWLEESGALAAREETLPPRTRLETRRSPRQIRFDTHDTTARSAVHVSVLAQ
jgi:hypothetical protein